MARTDTLTNFLTDVATAIKDKKGDTTEIKASDFDVEISNLSSGGNTPTKGFIAEEYDSDGYVTKARVVGMTSLPDGAFCNFNSTIGNFLGKNLKEVILPNDITSLGERIFNGCSNLATIKLENMTSIGVNCFYNCKALQLKKLANVKSIDKGAFYGCIDIVQMSMPNVEYIYGTDTNAPFRFNLNLKAFWIGSTIEKNGLGRYALQTSGTTMDEQQIKRIFIDLPRTTVQSFSGYGYKFVNSPSFGGIICNDDEGFLTKEEFDAIDWSVA